MERIGADLLTPGRGKPVRDGVVVLDGTAISYAGPAAEAPRTPGANVRRAPAVMPGMWECHGHFSGAMIYTGLYGAVEVDLVVERDAVVAGPRNLRLGPA